MRIRTDGDKTWRKDEINKASEVVGRNKTDSVIRACSHLAADKKCKEELAEYLADRVLEGKLEPEIASEITEILGDSNRMDHRNDLVFVPSIDVSASGKLQENR